MAPVVGSFRSLPRSTIIKIVSLLTCLGLLLLLLLFNSPDKEDKRKQNEKVLPDCTPENLKLQDASNGEWYLEPDGKFVFRFSHCKLRTFTREKAAQCLKGTHIAFIGDSLSRYLYIDLAHLFTFNKWPAPFSKHFHPENKPSILWERDFHSWPNYFHESNTILSSRDQSFEVCDCFREVGGLHIENRHFRYLPDRNLDDQENDVRLSYLQWYGNWFTMSGHKSISFFPRSKEYSRFVQHLNQRICPLNNEKMIPLSENCTAQRVASTEIRKIDFPLEFCQRLPDCADVKRRQDTVCQSYERDILGPLGVTHVIINTAWHSGLQSCDPNFLMKVVDASDRYFSKPGPSPGYLNGTGKYHMNLQLPRVLWRSCTAAAPFCSGDEVAKNYLNAEKNREKYDFFDVHSLTQRLQDYQKLIQGKDIAGLLGQVKLSEKWDGKRPADTTNIGLVWVDGIHLEPYVYTQIQTIFLNSVCPAEMH